MTCDQALGLFGTVLDCEQARQAEGIEAMQIASGRQDRRGA